MRWPPIPAGPARSTPVRARSPEWPVPTRSSWWNGCGVSPTRSACPPPGLRRRTEPGRRGCRTLPGRPAGSSAARPAVSRRGARRPVRPCAGVSGSAGSVPCRKHAASARGGLVVTHAQADAGQSGYLAAVAAGERELIQRLRLAGAIRFAITRIDGVVALPGGAAQAFEAGHAGLGGGLAVQGVGAVDGGARDIAGAADVDTEQRQHEVD